MVGKTIGIIAIKGGVGKTTVALNLGTVLAKEFGQKVLLIDTNFSAPNLGLHLGIVKPEKTIQDVLKERCSIKDAIINHEHGFDLVLGSLHEWRMKQPHKLKQKLEPLKQWYDYILLDSSPNLNDEIFATIMASDDLLIVTSPDHPTLSCTLHAAKVAKKRNTPIAGLILNKAHGKDFEITKEEIEDAAGVPVLAELPADLRVLESLANTTPSTLSGPMRELSIRYKHLAAQLLGKKYKDPRMSAKVRNFFSALVGKGRR
jgi:septum site-determining protein MinD